MKKSKKNGTQKAGKAGEKTATAKSKAATRAEVVKDDAAATTAEAGAEKGKAKKAAVATKPKRVSALDAAAQVLAKAGKPMRAQDLITAMAEQGLWSSPVGKTPHATLYAAMLREVAAKGKDARFTKVDRGLFAFNGKEA